MTKRKKWKTRFSADYSMLIIREIERERGEYLKETSEFE